MSSLVISDIDAKTLTRLSQWAENHGRTLEDEVRIVLQEATEEISRSAWERADAIRERLAATSRHFSDSAELIRQAREERMQ
jgi:plasmid stability protein